MPLRRQFVLVFVAFSVSLTAAGGWLAHRETSRTLEAELERTLQWVAGSAAEVGFDGDFLLTLRPGDEGTPQWISQYERIRRLQRYVDEAWIFRQGNTAIVSTRGPEEFPVGTRIFFLELYPDQLEEAWTLGESSTPLFQGLDRRFYKYGLVRIGSSDAMLAVLMQADYLEPLEAFRRRILLGSLLAVLVAALLAGFMAATIVQPLERLSRVALRIQRGRMLEPVEVERGDELGRLSRAMERMRVGIVQRDEQLRLMLAQVAHEIRNPLGGLELFASAAMESEDGEERNRLLGRVRYEVEALNQIINDFLAFARPLHPEAKLHDVRGPLKEAVDLVRMGLSRRGGAVSVELPEQPLLAQADPDHLKRMTLNLLKNAADAGDQVLLTGKLHRGEVVVSVKDNGPGVAAEERDRIFEPFFTDKEKGAGLGLAIVRRLAELNGGRVELHTPDPPGGEGAEFRIYLRSADEPPEPTAVHLSAT